MLPQSAIDVQKFLDEYEAVPSWDTYRTGRTEAILSMILQHIDGDILEIGAHGGVTTEVFCKTGNTYDRHVFVIDPWDGRQEGGNDAYIAFNARTRNFANLTTYKLGSENPAVLAKLIEMNVKFAFILVDGLHSHAAVTNDLSCYKDLLVPGGIISMDDWRGPYGFSKEIQLATREQLDDNYQELTTPDSFIESYFVRLA
jgi:hypothetical protein